MTSLNNFGSSALCKQWSKKKCLVTLVFVTVVLVVLCGNYKKIYLSTGNGSKVNGNVLLNSSRSLQGDAKSNNISHLEKYGTDFLYTSTPYQASTEFSPFKGKAIHIETSYEVNEKVVITHREKQVSSQVVCAQNQKFLVYVYSSLHDCDGAISELTGSLVKDLQLGDSWTNDPASACIFVVVVGLWRDTISSGDVSTMIHSLPYWKEYSHKHVLVELSHSSSNSKLLQQIDTNSALVATSYFTLKNTTTTLIPPVMSSQMPRIVIPPTDSLIRKRIKFTLYFEGELEGLLLTNSQLSDICRNCPKTSCSFKCSASRERGALEREWSLCNTATDRLVKCQKALFALVPCGMEGEVGPVTFTRLIEALQCGAIPIVVGDCVNRLPFSEVIEWEKAAMFVQPQELSLTFIFQSEKYARHYMEHGLFLYNTYFSSGLKIVESLIAIIRNHSNHPPMRYHDYIPEVLLNTMPRNSTTAPPNRTQYPQLVWNSPPGPFYIQSYMEYSIAGYLQPTTKLSTEKFTVVILTYHREKGLLHVVGSLKNCPLLDKVVVVWNNEQRYKHPKHFKWPNIGVPIEVVRGKGNSLNNRFLPFINIETEAILSLDDDVCLTQKQIVQGFRVWQEHRTVVVGWLSRIHSLHPDSSGSWYYRYIYSMKNCDYSMVLTGGAFFHKYYTYLYTYWMPESIRTFVQKKFNCEDIALNFLVSHITRQPPVTIGGKKSPECSRKKSGIHSHKNHIQERGSCLRQFENAYGYMPLLTSKYQAIQPRCKPK